MKIGVATLISEVATWAVLVGQKGGRDLRPGPRYYARDLRTLSVRPALAEHTTCVRAAALMTWALHAQCACNLVSGCAHCAHNPVL